MTVRRPRVRGLQHRFESALLPLFARRTPEVNDLLPELYLHGLAVGDFGLALRGLFGEQAPLSASTVARVKDAGTGKRPRGTSAAWRSWRWCTCRSTGCTSKRGWRKTKRALLVAIGGLADGRKVLITLRSGYRESTESWKGVLRDARQRGFGARGW